MAEYKCCYNKTEKWWEVWEGSGLQCKHIADVDTKNDAQAICIRDRTHVIFDDQRPDFFRVGSLEELFLPNKQGYEAINGIVVGFNDLVCRGNLNPELAVSKGITLSKLNHDIERLARFYSLRVTQVQRKQGASR